ncbi:CYTH and CHAD domain-containing protein [Rathayibacter rathayi]|uniref:CYTH and CHAD domain-containing protein n=1 Tax=Rathayibacter rathayi TaxID=33887 RepID=UPI000CE92A11|nr:CYTH and CHAD domain-containing protein [Rathayibacter rathayi]PPF25538.1 hypothetical protein C5C34_01620 [Rathayibacter rathayi]PPG96379.1 hypothetical protein C5C22_03445 [Rathayibacter rathayi]
MASGAENESATSPASGGRRVQTEVERKYDVDADTRLPDLAGAGIVATARAEQPVTLHAEYFDTLDRALSRARITLRRREGGADQGWHVKLPGSSGRTEIHSDLTPSRTVPSVVRESVLGQVGRAPLEPLALLETVRSVTRVVDSRGRQLAEIADDLVIARDQRTGRERRWREWEVELVDVPGEEGERILDAIEQRLLAAGARPAASASKLARATGGPIDEPVADPRDGGEAALAAVRSLLRELRAVDPCVRLEADDALHRMRVLTRRLRSVLAASRSVLDRAATDPVRDELRWLGGVLGAARDQEVLTDRFRASLAAVQGAPSVPSALLEEIERRHAAALRRVARTLRGGRYLALLASLDVLLADPPRTAKANSSATALVRRSVAKELSRIADARATMLGGSLEARHDLRKAAKRLRYTVEAWRAVVPEAVGARRRSLAEAAEDLADALGEERDALAARALILDQADRSGEGAFALGVVAAEERHRARRTAKVAEKAMTRLESLSS